MNRKHLGSLRVQNNLCLFVESKVATMILLQFLIVCFVLNFSFLNGQFQPVGSQPNVNLKFNLFSNPFEQKDEERLQKISDVEKPSSAQNFARASGVRRKFGLRRTWSLTPTNNDLKPTVNFEKHREQPGGNINAIVNPFLKTTTTVLPTTRATPSTHYPVPIQTNVDDRNLIVQETSQKSNVPATVRAEDEYEFGQASFLVPCQWGGCLGDFRCMRIENNIAIVCDENSMELCQCMRKKVNNKPKGTHGDVPRSNILKVSKPEEEMPESGDLSLSVPDDMEVGVEGIPGMTCQYVGCLNNFECMAIKKGRPVTCTNNIEDQCRCLRKKSPGPQRDFARPHNDMPLQLSTEMPLVMATDSAIPCQFWGCESGYQCLLLVNGQKRECPANSNAVCQCIRHVLG